MKVQLIDFMWDDTKPVRRARVSYNGDWKQHTPEQDQKLLNRLMWDWHFWVLEWNIFEFMIECSIPIARQIMRHRTFSYNEQSRRYLDWDHTPFEFETPEPRWNKDAKLDLDFDNNIKYNEIFEKTYKNSLRAYNEALEMWAAKETARYLLPQGMVTRFYMTGNLRNWLHFIKLRGDSHAQKEVRDVSDAIEIEITNKVPGIMTAYKNSQK